MADNVSDIPNTIRDDQGNGTAPFLSVIIPLYNRVGSIGDTLKSIRPPTEVGIEIIVVDDGSTDGSVEEAKAFAQTHDAAVRVLIQQNAGPGAARNTGAAAANGTYLAFLDSDDIWFPWTASICADAAIANPDAALIFLQQVNVNEAAKHDEPPLEPVAIESRTGFLDAAVNDWSIMYASANVVIRKDVFDDLGGFTTDVRCAEDTDLFLRADDQGRCVLVKAPVMIGHVVDGDDRLTGDAPRVIEGLNYVFARDRAGAYPGGPNADPKRNILLAESSISSVRTAFANGHPVRAYGVLLRRTGAFLRTGRWRNWLRLALTPVLHLVRPQNYRFHLRPPR